MPGKIFHQEIFKSKKFFEKTQEFSGVTRENPLSLQCMSVETNTLYKDFDI